MGAKTLTDAKTDPRYGPNVVPMIKEFVQDLITAENSFEGKMWQAVANAQKCRFELNMEEKELKRQVREELEKKFDPQQAVSRSYNINKAIRVAYTKTIEEVNAAKKVKGFSELYSECSNKKPSRVSYTSDNDVMISKNGESDSKAKRDADKLKGKSSWNRFEKEEEKTVSLEELAQQLAFKEKLTRETVYRVVEIYLGEDFDVTKDFVNFLLEENEWAADVARDYCKR